MFKPKGQPCDELRIHDALEATVPARVRFSLALPAGVAGLFVALFVPHSVIFVGPLAGMYALYRWLGPIWRAGRRMGASEYEVIRRE